jgi:hypothetical protein
VTIGRTPLLLRRDAREVAQFSEKRKQNLFVSDLAKYPFEPAGEIRLSRPANFFASPKWMRAIGANRIMDRK